MIRMLDTDTFISVHHYGRVRAMLEAVGMTIGPLDLLIAAQRSCPWSHADHPQHSGVQTGSGSEYRRLVLTATIHLNQTDALPSAFFDHASLQIENSSLKIRG